MLVEPSLSSSLSSVQGDPWHVEVSKALALLLVVPSSSSSSSSSSIEEGRLHVEFSNSSALLLLETSLYIEGGYWHVEVPKASALILVAP